MLFFNSVKTIHMLNKFGLLFPPLLKEIKVVLYLSETVEYLHNTNSPRDKYYESEHIEKKFLLWITYILSRLSSNNLKRDFTNFLVLT